MRIFIKTNNLQPYKELTLYGSERIGMNSSWDNLENPSNLLSDHTESFTIPRCSVNNEIFGHFPIIDNRINPYGYLPNEKMPCEITTNTLDHILSGYCYVSKITDTDYTLEVCGGLSNFFHNVKSLNYDEYLCKGLTKDQSTGKYELVNNDWHYGINSQKVANSWQTSNQIHASYNALVLGGRSNVVDGMTMSEIYLNTLVGWAMCNSDDYEDFESGKWLTRQTMNIPQFYDTSNMSAADKASVYVYRKALFPSIVDAFVDGTYTLVDGRNVLLYDKDKIQQQDEDKGKVISVSGLNEHNMQQYRSYYQHPFLWLKSWFEVFAESVKKQIGYDVTIDDGIIENESIYMLPRFYDGTKNEILSYENIATTITKQRQSIQYVQLGNQKKIDGSEFNVTAKIGGQSLNQTEVGKYEIDIDFGIQVPISTGMIYLGYHNPILIHLTPTTNPIIINGKTLAKRYCVIPLPRGFKDSDVGGNLHKNFIDYWGDQGYELIYCYYDALNSMNIQLELDLNAMVMFNNFRRSTDTKSVDYDIDIDIMMGTKMNPMTYSNGNKADFIQMNMVINDINTRLTKIKSDRTGKELSLNNLLKGQSIFDILVGYTKLKHCVWLVDDTNKTLRIRKVDEHLSEKFFETTNDITRNIDFSKIEQYPISWDFERVQMKHNDIEAIKDYDTMVITTPNHITLNDDSYDIFEESACCVMAQKTHKDFYILGIETKSQCPYILPITSDSNVNFYAYNNWSNPEQHSFLEDSVNYPVAMNDVYKRRFHITDDTHQEWYNSTFCWHNLLYTNRNISVSENTFGHTNRPMGYYTQTGTGYLPPALNINYGWSFGDIWTTVKPYVTDYNIDCDSILYSRPQSYLYNRYDDVRQSFVIDNYIEYINQIYNQNNRKIVTTATLSYNEWKRVKKNPFVMVGDVLFLATELGFWNEIDGICEITLKKVTSPFPWINQKYSPTARTHTVVVTGGDGNTLITKSGLFEVLDGDKVKLRCELTDNKKFYFVGWIDQFGNNVCVYKDYDLTVHSDMILTPVAEMLDDKQYWLNLTTNGQCLVAGDGRYDKGYEVSIDAIPLDGWYFDYWLDIDTNEVYSYDRTTQVVMNREYNLQAVCHKDEICEDNLQTNYTKVKLEMR